jgi:hypothetical protein
VLSGSHLKTLAANQLPEAFNSIVRSAGANSQKDLVPTPNLDKHVFCRVLEDRGHVTVDEEGWVPMAACLHLPPGICSYGMPAKGATVAASLGCSTHTVSAAMPALRWCL